jgi:hypothetical protein
MALSDADAGIRAVQRSVAAGHGLVASRLAKNQ